MARAEIRALGPRWTVAQCWGQDEMAKWLAEEDAVAHIAACTWYQKDGSVRIRIPARGYARALLQIELAGGGIRARGPLQFPQGVPHVPNPYWATIDIPLEFWIGSELCGKSGFQNRSRSECVRWFEVNETDFFKRWPQSALIPMPAPFDVDWPLLSEVVEAMNQRLDVSEAGSCKRLYDEWHRGALRARKLFDTGASQEVDATVHGDLEGLPKNSIASLCEGLGATQASDRREEIQLCRDEVVALWPELVLDGNGGIAAPIVVLPKSQSHPDATTEDLEPDAIHRFPGRPSIKRFILSEMEDRFANGLQCDTLGAEARWLYDWATTTFPRAQGLPGASRSVENQIRKQYRELRAKVGLPIK